MFGSKETENFDNNSLSAKMQYCYTVLCGIFIYLCLVLYLSIIKEVTKTKSNYKKIKPKCYVMSKYKDAALA